MIGLIFIGVALLLVFIFLKIEHAGRLLKVFLLVVIGALIFFSLSSLIKSNAMDVDSPQGVIQVVTVYFKWMGNAITNLVDVSDEVISIVGNAIKVNWTEETKS
jgi:hypothetical protein